MAVSDYLTKLGMTVSNIDSQLFSILGNKFFNKVDIETVQYSIGLKSSDDTYLMFKLPANEHVTKVTNFKFSVIEPEDVFIGEEVEL